ncbi:Sirohydrochlorin cobaltochelatase, partial [human gut metagenome]
VIQDRIHTLGMKNVFIYTVEGTPNLEQVIPQLKSFLYKLYTAAS